MRTIPARPATTRKVVAGFRNPASTRIGRGRFDGSVLDTRLDVDDPCPERECEQAQNDREREQAYVDEVDSMLSLVVLTRE
jgi:hypothetical protein